MFASRFVPVEFEELENEIDEEYMLVGQSVVYYWNQSLKTYNSRNETDRVESLWVKFIEMVFKLRIFGSKEWRYHHKIVANIMTSRGKK